MLTILRRHGGTASEAIEPYRRYPQTGEINFRVEDKAAVQQQLKQRYEGRAAIDELDGVTLDAWDREGWWFNVRPSNTEPVLRFNAEASDRDGLQRLVQEVAPMLGEREEG
jgi:phosphomannomutase